MSAFADQNHAPSLTCVRLEFALHSVGLERETALLVWETNGSADRGGLYVLRDLEQDSVNPVLSPSGLISCKKGYPIGYPFA